jgi:4-hydroxybenzoate polyprenyltransferase
MDMTRLNDRLTQYERLMRLDKPIGILLLLWPTLWAVWISSYGHPDPVVVWIFVLGTVLMRSAGCVMNDMADAGFDARVQRTSNRPLVTGTVSRREAFVLASLLTLAAFALVLYLGWMTVMLSVVALGLAATYPFTKRFFALPQAYLGVAFGFGIPMAFAAQLGTLSWLVGWLMAANIFWAIAYDTEYAMVDRDDDVKIGIRTAAITFGRYDVAAVMVCYAVMLGIMFHVGRKLNFGIYYNGSLAVAAAIMVYHYRLIRGRDRERCFKAFLHNNWVGAVIFAGMLIEYALRSAAGKG